MASIFVGLQTSADKIYILKELEKPAKGKVPVEDREGTQWQLERDIVRPFLNDTSLSTFDAPLSRHWLVFPYVLNEGRPRLLSEDEMSSNFPLGWRYLCENSKVLRAREAGKADTKEWYGYLYRKNLTLFDAPKLIVQVISIRGRYAYDDSGLYFTGGGNGPYYGIRCASNSPPYSIHYLQALLQSKLLDFQLHQISSPFRGGYWSYGKRFIENLPIRMIDFSDPTDKSLHDHMVSLVDQMLVLHKQLATARTPHEKTSLQTQITATDRQIDRIRPTNTPCGGW